MALPRGCKVDGLDIFYREAGPKNAPTLLLLHGFPASSHMFRNLIPALADRYHVVAPDYPGFGQSSMPKVGEFNYTFERLSQVVEGFTQALGLSHRTFAIDVFACVRCGGRRRVLAYVNEAGGMRAILEHLGLPTAGARLAPAREPLQAACC